jgi:hypothetical protein
MFWYFEILTLYQLQVLERIHAVIKLTWIRMSPYISRYYDFSYNYLPFSLPAESGSFQLILFVFRLVDELVLLYKESATRKSREIMRDHIVKILMLLQK